MNDKRESFKQAHALGTIDIGRGICHIITKLSPFHMSEDLKRMAKKVGCSDAGLARNVVIPNEMLWWLSETKEWQKRYA